MLSRPVSPPASKQPLDSCVKQAQDGVHPAYYPARRSKEGQKTSSLFFDQRLHRRNLVVEVHPGQALRRACSEKRGAHRVARAGGESK